MDKEAGFGDGVSDKERGSSCRMVGWVCHDYPAVKDRMVEVGPW